jgi:hypothetical protein
LEVGLRTGYGLPFGKASGNEARDLSDFIAGQVPIWVHLGARVDGNVAFGVFYSYGFGIVGSYLRQTCDLLEASASGETVDVSCYTRSHRAGIQVGYHFIPEGDLDPWIAAGLGHEFFDFTLSSASRTRSATSTIDADGFEYGNFQFGLDYRLDEHFRVGPFLGLSASSYGELTRSCHGDCGVAGSDSGNVGNRSRHVWIYLGLRGVALR